MHPISLLKPCLEWPIRFQNGSNYWKLFPALVTRSTCSVVGTFRPWCWIALKVLTASLKRFLKSLDTRHEYLQVLLVFNDDESNMQELSNIYGKHAIELTLKPNVKCSFLLGSIWLQFSLKSPCCVFMIPITTTKSHICHVPITADIQKGKQKYLSITVTKLIQ